MRYNTSYFSDLKSHPKKLLENHLREVSELSREIVRTKKIKNSENIEKVSYLIGISHDFGKATTFFQEKLNKGERTHNANHSFISALFGYYILSHYFPGDKVPLYGWIVISRHHGDLKNITPTEVTRLRNGEEREILEKQIEDLRTKKEKLEIIFQNLLDDFEYKPNMIEEFLSELNQNMDEYLKRISNGLKEIERSNKIDHYFSIMFLYSVLLDADKLSGCDYSDLPLKERIKLNDDIVDVYLSKMKSYSKNEINELRRMAYNEAIKKLNSTDIKNHRIFDLNLPTGLGKTLISMSVAIKLRNRVNTELGFLPKIIYAAPFLSIIDQNKKVFEDVLTDHFGGEIPSKLLIDHHHISDIFYKEEKELEPLEPEKALILIEGWHSEIIVTTFVQLFHSLITNRNRAARKFHNITNSIIILDEFQTIPTKYWSLIREALEYLSQNYNCFIIVMSATQPLIFQKEECINLVDEPEYFNKVNRYAINFKGEFTFEKFKEDILDELKSNDVMIILNTIKSCKELYTYLKQKLADTEQTKNDENGICKLKDGTMLINLSSNIIPYHRLNRIDEIKKNKDNRKIIITTQLIEAGVDISIPVVFRDFCPLDSIIQSAGRTNRNFESSTGGDIHILYLIDERKKYFSNYIYDQVLLYTTKRLIEKLPQKTISEKDFVLPIYKEYCKELTNKVSEEESRQVLEILRNLKFEEIMKFKLIEDEIPAIDIFVEINDDAKCCLQDYKRCVQLLKEKRQDPFRLIAETERIKRKLYQYTISVSLNKINPKELENIIENVETFKVVRKEKDTLDKYYDMETGFKDNEKNSFEIL